MPLSKSGNIGFFIGADPKPSGSLKLNIKGPNLSCGWSEARDLWTSYTLRNWSDFVCTQAAGFSSSNFTMTASGANKITSTGSMPLYQPVHETTGNINSSVSLHTSGPVQISSNIPLYLPGSLKPSGAVSLFAKGHSLSAAPYGPSLGVSSSSINLYASGASTATITDNLTFFLKPETTGTVTSQMPIWTQGIGNKLNNNVNLYIQNMQISGSVPMYVDGFFTTVSVPFSTVATTRGLTKTSIGQKTISKSSPETSVSITGNPTVIGPVYNASVASIDSTWTKETVDGGKPATQEMNLFIKNIGSAGSFSLSIPSGHINSSGLVTLFASGALIQTGSVDLVIPSPSASGTGMMDTIITGYV